MLNHLLDSLLPVDREESRLCLICPDGRRLSYGDVARASRRYAGALRACGVSRGDRVVVQVDKSPEALFLYLACIRAGAVFLPLNTAYTAAEVGYFVGDSEPALLVGRAEHENAIRSIGDAHGVGRIETLGEDGGGTLARLAERQPDGFADAETAPSDLATILYTSGTTGRSKGAMLSHANLQSNAKALVETWRFTSEDTLLHALPIYHAHGLFVATNVSLMAGASMIFLPKFDPGEMLAWMPQASVMMGVPTFYTRLLDNPALTRDATASMRLFVSGSAPLLADTHVAFRERTGHAILERYGMTETSMNTSNPYDGARVPGSVGLPLPGVEVRVTEPESARVLGTEEIGMLEVRGPNVFSGYWRMPEKTASEFREGGFFITGDLGKIDADGYVWILGRGRDLIITGGYNVYPKEVEVEIDALPGVLESAVIGVPHRDFGEGVAAVVVPRPGCVIEEADIIDALRGRLANYKLPKRVIVAEELPRNAMAKVQKAVLREQHAGLFG
jgi:malonyl-CoA/methylmalonyl-CoA synthetase